MHDACIPTHTYIHTFLGSSEQEMENNFLKVLCIHIRDVCVKNLYQVKLVCLNLY